MRIAAVESPLSERHYATQESRLMLRKVRGAGSAGGGGDIRILLGNETGGLLGRSVGRSVAIHPFAIVSEEGRSHAAAVARGRGGGLSQDSLALNNSGKFHSYAILFHLYT